MKRLKSFNQILVLLLPILVSSCATSNQSTIQNIYYGTSFGMCVGYCKHDIILSKDSINSNCSGWNNSVTPKSETVVQSSAIWDDLKVKFNSTSFFNMEEVVGCPDCADGGAEWVEIKMSDNNKHKVTFEYQNEPKVLKEFVSTLRKISSEHQCN